MVHPASALTELVHQRARLGILAVVHEADRAEFGFLQETLDLTSGNLSRHLQALEAAGLITIERGYHGKRARTWVRVTKLGRQALAEEIAHLKELISRVEQPRQAEGSQQAPGAAETATAAPAAVPAAAPTPTPKMRPHAV